MKVIKFLTMAVIAVCLASCGTYTKGNPYSVNTEMRISMNDLVFLGEGEISCEYETYLGFIKQLTKVNGKEYIPGTHTKLNVPGLGGILKSKGLTTAAYDLVKKYPSGEYFQVVYEQKSSDKLFLGTSVKSTAKIRVYKFK